MNFDWFDTLLSNPDKDVEYLQAAGLNESNTDFKDKDYYRNNAGVIDFFTDKNTGEFNETAFNKFYDNSAKAYDNYMQNLQDEKALTIDLDFFRDRQRLDGSVYLKKVANPTGSTMGIEGVNRYSEGKISMREAAQNNYVRDPLTGESLGWKPNDDDRRGLIDFLFQKPVVEARWEEDGVHIDPMTGQQVQHSKGDWKLDENGNPFYEELHGDGTGKNYLHLEDTLTVDGTFWNKFDPFDSDGVSKNIGGQIMKTAITIAPLLIPGVNMYYGAAMSGVLLSSALSSLGKAGVEALDSDYMNNSLWRGLNSYSAYMSRFDRSISDEGSESMMNFEQATNLLSDVVGQLYQQRAVAYIPRLLKWDKNSSREVADFLDKYGDTYLKKYGKTIQKAIEDNDAEVVSFLSKSAIASHWNRLNNLNTRAADMSKLYMVLTQTEGAYEIFKENNFDEVSTAIGVLGTAYGFHRLFNSSLGELALSGLGLDEMSGTVKNILRNMAKERKEVLVGKAAEAVSEETAKKGALNSIKEWGISFADKFKDLLSKGTIRSSMLKEGIEEVSEELNQDVMLYSSAQLENALDTLGWRKKTNTYEYLKTNPFERYLMSALGGAVGGAVFPMMTKWENFAANGFKNVNKLPDDDITNLITILMKTPREKVEAVIQSEIASGKFGSTVLSATPTENSNGEITYGKAKSAEDSQNNVIGQNILATVRAIDSILKAETPNLSEDGIIDSALGRQIRAKLLMDQTNGAKIIADDFKNIFLRLTKAKAAINSVKDGEQPSEVDQQLYRDAKQDLEDLLSGKRAGEYTEKLAFLINPALNAPFMSATVQTFALQFGKNYSTLNDSERAKMDSLFKTYTIDDTSKANAAYNLFKHFKTLTEPELRSLSNESNTDAFNYRRKIQGELKSLEDSLLSSNISKKEIDEQEKLIREEYKTPDEFISAYNLDPKGLLDNDSDKEAVVERFIQDSLEKWKDRELNRRASVNMNSHLGVGFDNTLALANNEKLKEFATKVGEISAVSNYIDAPTLTRLNNIFGIFNSVNADDIITKATQYVWNALERGEAIIIDRSDITGAEDDLYISKNDIHWLNTGDSYIINGSDVIEPTTKMIEDFVKGHLTTHSTNLNKLVGGIVNGEGILEGSDATYSEGVSIAKYIQDSLAIDPYLMGLNNTLSKLKEKSTKGPIWEMLSKLSTEVLGEDIFDIIKRENLRLEKLNRLTDYVLNNSITESQLSDMLSLIQVAQSLVLYHSRLEEEFDPTGANFSMLDVINDSRKISGENPLFEFKEQDARVIINDLKDLADSINLLFIISNNNNVSKLQDDKLTLLRSELLFIKIFNSRSIASARFFSNSGKESIATSDGKLFFDFDISPYEEELSKIESSSNNIDEGIKFVDKVFTEMQTYYYNKFNNELSEDSQRDILNALATVRDEDNPIGLDYNYNIHTKLTRNSVVEDIAPEMVAHFALSMISADQSQIKKDFLQVLSKSGSYAPFFGQYLDISMAVAMITNPKYINYYLEALQTRNSKHRISEYAWYNNTITLLGDPGSGKTTGVAYFIKEISKLRDPDISIISAAPNSDQAEKFSGLLGLEDSYNRDAIYDMFLTEEGLKFRDEANKAIIDFKNDRTSTEKEQKLREYCNSQGRIITFDPAKFLKSPEKNTILFIDEYTHFDSVGIQMLSKIPNLKIVMLGDPKQEGTPAGFPVGIIYSAPNLNMSVRANNGYKKDNLDVISAELKDAQERIDIANLANKVVDLRGSAKKLKEEIKLRYFEDNNELQGDKIVDSVDKQTIQKLLKNLKDKEKLCLITDKEKSGIIDILSELSNSPEYKNKIIIKDPSEVQGSEYKYTIVDVTYPPIDYNTASSRFNYIYNDVMTRFYTHITRSSDGSIIIREGNNLPIDESINYRFPSNSKLSQSDIDTYKSFISDVYSNSVGIKNTPSSIEGDNRTTDKKLPEIVERAHKVIRSGDSEEFLKNNLALYSRSNHIGLARQSSGNYKKIENSNEDLNLVIGDKEYTADEIIGTNAYIGWRFIRRAALNKDAIKLISATDLNSTYKEWADILLKNTTSNKVDEFRKILSNGKILIKIDQRRADIDYNLDSPNYNYNERLKELGITSNNYARLIYQITGDDGQIYEITLSDLPLELQDKKLKDVFSSNLTEPRYFTVDTSKIVKRSFNFWSSVLDDNGVPVIDDKTGRTIKDVNSHKIPLSYVKKKYPELFISSVYYYTDGPNKGRPFVLVTDDPTITSDEEAIDAYSENDPYRVMDVSLDHIHYTYEDFFDRLHTLVEDAHKSKEVDFLALSKFAPNSFTARVIYALNKLQNILKDPSKVKEYNDSVKARNEENKNFNEETERVHGGYYKRDNLLPIDTSENFSRALAYIINSFSEEAYKIDVEDVGITTNELNKVIENITKHINNLQGDILKNDPTNLLTKDSPFTYVMPRFTDKELSFINKLTYKMKARSAFEKLADKDSDVYKSEAAIKAIGEGDSTIKNALIEKSKQALDFINNLYMNAQGYTMEQLLPYIKSGVLFYGSKNASALKFFDALWNNSDPNYKKALITALEVSGVFDSIWVTVRDVQADFYRGFVNALATQDQVYTPHTFQPRTLYIPYSAIGEMQSSRQVESNSNKVNSIDNLKEEFKKNIHTSINDYVKNLKSDTFNEEERSAYIETINNIIDSAKVRSTGDVSRDREALIKAINPKIFKTNKIIWNERAELISLDFEQGVPKIKNVEINREYLSNINSKKINDALSNFSDENIKPSYISDSNEIIFDTNQGYYYVLSLNDKGNVNLTRKRKTVNSNSESSEQEDKGIKVSFNEESIRNILSNFTGLASNNEAIESIINKIKTSKDPVKDIMDALKKAGYLENKKPISIKLLENNLNKNISVTNTTIC